jgi:CheY-like chemotaxis protein
VFVALWNDLRNNDQDHDFRMNHESDKTTSAAADAENVLTGILDELDACPSTPVSQNHRIDERFRYRKKRLTAWIQQPGDAAPKKHSVLPRNLSEGGVGFLHSGFVHTGSKVTVQLITLHGTWQDVEGLVATCRHVRGALHEVGVQFLTHIQPSVYCTDAVHPRILLVDDDPFIIRLGKVMLTKLNADVTCVDDGQAAIDVALRETFDLIMMDVEMPIMDGLTATRELRSKGYSGRIVAATARTQSGDRESCIEAGFDDYFPKPYDKDALARLLESVNREPVFSSLSDDPATTEIVNAFIADLPQRIREFEEASQGDDAHALEMLARRMKGDGAMYGFEILTELATTLESAVVGETSVTKARREVTQLVQMCMQVRSTSISNEVPTPTEDHA